MTVFLALFALATALTASGWLTIIRSARYPQSRRGFQTWLLGFGLLVAGFCLAAGASAYTPAAWQ